VLKQKLIEKGVVDEYEFLDVSTPKGLELAKKLGVTHVPDCVIVKETKDGVMGRLCSEEEMQQIMKGE